MRFIYECCDCHQVYETDEVFYQCPSCAQKNDGTAFPLGNVIVKLNEEDLAKLKEQEHVSMYDFFPYQVPHKDVYPVGGTPIAFREFPKSNILALPLPKLASSPKRRIQFIGVAC